MTLPYKKTAIISVADKTNLLPLAKILAEQKINILATRGTAVFLETHKIPVFRIENYTKQAEMLRGRVKTLQAKIFAGILANRNYDLPELNSNNIHTIDFVIVNLYPFEKIINNPTTTYQDIIENIDIGGVSLTRAAAKNYESVIAITNPKDYSFLINKLKNNLNFTIEEQQMLAAKAFLQCSNYDNLIGNYLLNNSSLNFNQQKPQLPDNIFLAAKKQQVLRYGENPQQNAAVYNIYAANPSNTTNNLNITDAKQLQGKELSYNNIVDAQKAYNCCLNLIYKNYNTCVIVKHGVPCGIALADNTKNAYTKAYLADPISAFGGIIACDNEINSELATIIINKQFVELIIAPNYTYNAKKVFATKKNLRLLELPFDNNHYNHNYLEYRIINNNLLVQNQLNLNFDNLIYNNKNFKLLSKPQQQDCLFGLKILKFVPSNAIIIVQNRQTLGIGAAQTNRLASVKIAITNALNITNNLQNSILLSDGMFPFADNIELIGEHNIKMVVQPGGSIKDPEIILAAQQKNINMIMTNMRLFTH